MSLPPGCRRFAASISSWLSFSMCSITSIYRMVLNFLSAGRFPRKPLNGMLGVFWVFSMSFSSSCESGSMEVSEVIAGQELSILSEFAPIPAPTSAVSPETCFLILFNQYSFQFVACSNSSNSLPM